MIPGFLDPEGNGCPEGKTWFMRADLLHRSSTLILYNTLLPPPHLAKLAHLYLPRLPERTCLISKITCKMQYSLPYSLTQRAHTIRPTRPRVSRDLSFYYIITVSHGTTTCTIYS